MIRTWLWLSLLAALATASPWNVALDANLTVNQNAYSTNWAGGATGLLAYALNSNLLAEKQLGPKLNTRNTVKLAFGENASQDTAGKWGPLLKSTDEIDAQSLLRFTLGLVVDPFISAELQSQFWDKSDPTLSRYVNPLDLKEALGVARSIIKHDTTELVSRLGFGLEQKVNRQVPETIPDFGIAAGRATRSSNYGGITFETDFNTALATGRVFYTGKLALFQALFYSDAARLRGRPNADYWKALDVDWENALAVSITKVLMVNLDAQLMYDKEISARVRLKETLSLGLTYKFI